MEEKLKNKIDEMKKDKSSYKKYIKSFCESEKAKELFNSNDEFNTLKESTDEKKKDKKEDEYF